tara:strand:- start:232 stop:1272 length:1041 start_codon:yes stop_codon:yes gene_type:complete
MTDVAIKPREILRWMSDAGLNRTGLALAAGLSEKTLRNLLKSSTAKLETMQQLEFFIRKYSKIQQYDGQHIKCWKKNYEIYNEKNTSIFNSVTGKIENPSNPIKDIALCLPAHAMFKMIIDHSKLVSNSTYHRTKSENENDFYRKQNDIYFLNIIEGKKGVLDFGFNHNDKNVTFIEQDLGALSQPTIEKIKTLDTLIKELLDFKQSSSADDFMSAIAANDQSKNEKEFMRIIANLKRSNISLFGMPYTEKYAYRFFYNKRDTDGKITDELHENKDYSVPFKIVGTYLNLYLAPSNYLRLIVDVKDRKQSHDLSEDALLDIISEDGCGPYSYDLRNLREARIIDEQ